MNVSIEEDFTTILRAAQDHIYLEKGRRVIHLEMVKVVIKPDDIVEVLRNWIFGLPN
jgi:hypothetical protein